MNTERTYHLSLLSWNILAPCWVNREWYPSLYEVAADHQTRLEMIGDRISSLGHDVVFIQEAQEDRITLLKERLNDAYSFDYVSNDPTTASLANGLLTLIRKNWQFASEIKIINGILDRERGEAIQIVIIPSRQICLVNLHLDYIHRALQANMVHQRCNELLGSAHSISIMAGDLNAETAECKQFQWIGYEDAFNDSDEKVTVPTYYPDAKQGERNTAVDHVFYDPTQVQLVQYGKAWDRPDRSLADSLKVLGSDHIYVWTRFNFFDKAH